MTDTSRAETILKELEEAAKKMGGGIPNGLPGLVSWGMKFIYKIAHVELSFGI